MKIEELENQNNSPEIADDGSAAQSGAETAVSELREPRWSIVSFETRTAKNLTYWQAEQQIAELKKQGVSGLCIITDEAAERISEKLSRE